MQRSNTVRGLLVVVAAAVWGYTAFRTWSVGITHDEAYTFTRYMDDPVWKLITYDMVPLLPNNHVLNTLGVKFFTLFGTHPFWLRLSTLLAFGGLLVAAVSWLRRLEGPFLPLIGFMCLFGNPYVLDFFGLARGYGMGMVFLGLAVFALFRYNRQPGPGRVWPVFAAGLLSVEANFTLLNFYLALLLVFLLLVWSRHREGRIPALRGHLRPAAVWTLLTFALVARPLYRITAAHQLFGGSAGFWQDTVRSLLRQTLYGRPYAEPAFPWLNGAVAVLLVVFGLYLLWQFYETRWKALQQPFVLAFGLTGLAALGIIAQHHLFQTEYLTDRTGVFFLPMFALCLITWLEAVLARAPQPRWVAGVLGLGLLLPVAYHAVQCANTRYVLEWKYDANGRDMLVRLEQELQKDSTLVRPLRLGVNPHFEPSTNFYRITRHLDWLQEIHQDGFGAGQAYDFGYIFPSDLDNPDRRLKGQVIGQFQPSEGMLVR